jgi:hypothetical protein
VCCAGLQNDELQIRAYFGNEGKTIVCGSENQNVYVWCVRAGVLASVA